jgi:hypothetical protein
MKKEYLNFKSSFRNDEIYIENNVLNLAEITNLPTRKGLENVIVSGGTIVNVVSNSYGHLPNENYFKEVEEKLINAEINYKTRSINRDNRSFAVDYILDDENFEIEIKNGADKIKPMLRFTNSYDGSCKTSGHFGFFREVCSNGLHVADTEIGFSVKHRGNISQIVLPEINHILKKFMDNEFYTLHRKFEVLAETPITDLKDFVKNVCGKTALFKFESSEKNPEPSLNARLVIDAMQRESDFLKTPANLWLGYNAFNEVLHEKLQKPFGEQKRTDARIFNTILEMAN